MAGSNKYDYRPSDYLAMLPLSRIKAGGICTAKSEMQALHRELDFLAASADVPIILRDYYRNLAAKVDGLGAQLGALENETRNEAQDFRYNIQRKDQLPLSKKEMAKLYQVNARLIDLEKLLFSKATDLRTRLIGAPDPTDDGVKWDTWDGVDIELWLIFEPDSERPSYHHGTARDEMNLENLAFNDIRIWLNINDAATFNPADKNRWGIADGLDHNDISGIDGHPFSNLPQCSLFHEIYDHAEVGIQGMLRLSQIWFDVNLKQSGYFTL